MSNTTTPQSYQHQIHIHTALPATDCRQSVAAILTGLQAQPKRIASLFFYDAVGSKLFEDITRLPEYYLTRLEKTLLAATAPDLAPMLDHTDIVELGSGDCSKIAILLDAVPAAQLASLRYIPVDISAFAVQESAQLLAQRYRGALPVHGIIADFLQQLNTIPRERSRLFCFFGSTLGNLNADQARAFFAQLGSLMRPGEQLLLGVDQQKSPHVLEAAYNDSQNVTAAFNRNILRVVNNLTGTNFDPDQFAHVAFYNPTEARIEMHLQATAEVWVSCPELPQPIHLGQGEMIHTENSYKFNSAGIAALVNPAGLCLQQTLMDPDNWFALLQFVKT